MKRLWPIALLLLVAAPAIAAERSRPNVIVILADDVGYSDLGCYGSEIHTPNLDALAAGGLRFTQFYNTARCCPSRAALLTGLYSHQAGVGHMVEDKGLDGFVGDINRTSVTIPEVLHPAGYANYMVGKWHVTKHTKPEGPKDNWPTHRGFDRYYGTILGSGNFFDPGGLCRDDVMVSPFVDKAYQPQAGEPYYYTSALSDQACRFIGEHEKKSHADQPFFLYVAYTAAHWPMHALEADIAKYKGKYDAGYEPIRRARYERMKQMGLIDPQWDLSPLAGDWAGVKNKAWEARCMEVYAAMLDRMDQGVGQIVDTLKKTGQFENTLILYMQDNGGNLEDQGRKGNDRRADHPTLPKLPPEFIQTGRPKQTRDGWPVLSGEGVMPGPADTFIAYGKSWANVSNTPLREYKHYVHEGGIATPLIAHWPKGIARRGELERQPGHLIDVMATCVDLAKADYPKEFAGKAITPLEGKSLVPAFGGKPIEREALYWEHEGNRAVRQGDWKLVAKGAGAAWELYNLATDRTEQHDLATSSPDKARELQGLWEKWAKRAHVLPWPWKPAYGEKAAAGAPAAPARGDGQAVALALKAGAELKGKQAPSAVGKSVRIEATLAKAGRDGVIVAHGGTATGYALYVRDGKLSFAVRHDNGLALVAATADLAAGAKVVTATLEKDGGVTLAVDGQTVATGKTPGPITQAPKDGLQVGKDGNAPVGDYATPFPFTGEIAEVKLTLTP